MAKSLTVKGLNFALIDTANLKLSRLVCLLALVNLVSACAYSRFDDNGVQHIIGFGSVKVAPPENTGVQVIQQTELRSFGVTIYSHPNQSGLAVGYSAIKTTSVSEDVLVAFDDEGNPKPVEKGYLYEE
jgi:hypothetical protein